MGLRVQVTFDAADPGRLADFWAVALNYVPQPPPDGFASWEEFAAKIGMSPDQFNDVAAVIDPDGQGPRVFIQKVPEGKVAKNRVHLDIRARENPSEDWSVVTAHVDRLVTAGATVLYEQSDAKGRCMVMQDPEGNEFCVQ